MAVASIVEAAEREYILGTGRDELDRLGYQHRVWLEQAARAWDQAGFTLGHTLLDVGCGPGFATIDLAHLVGAGGRVIAVDESPRFVDHLRSVATALGLTQIDARRGDVQELLIDESTIDGAYARWVLCFVPRPQAVVDGVARALKPGGVFVVQDYSNYLGLRLAPPSRIMRRVVEAVERSWRDGGGDPEIGLRLPSMMEGAGLEVIDVRPVTRVASPGTALWNWPTTFFRNFLPVLVSKGYLSAGDAEEWRTEWAAHTANPAARFSTPPMFNVIGRKR
jgi:SAM-dependent methyltransferase